MLAKGNDYFCWSKETLCNLLPVDYQTMSKRKKSFIKICSVKKMQRNRTESCNFIDLPESSWKHFHYFVGYRFHRSYLQIINFSLLIFTNFVHGFINAWFAVFFRFTWCGENRGVESLISLFDSAVHNELVWPVKTIVYRW